MRSPALRLALIAVFTAGLLVAPVLALALITSRDIGSELESYSAEDRQLTAAVVGRLVETRLAAAGVRLTSVRLDAASAAFAGGSAALTREVERLRASSAIYSSAAAFGPDGTMLARDPESSRLVGQSFAARDYFIGALSSHAPYVSEAFRSVVYPFSPLVAVAYAVRDGARVIGVLLVTLAPVDILMAFDPVSKTDGRHITVTDKAWRIIASTDTSREFMSPGAPVAEPSGAAIATVDLAGTGWRVHVTDTRAVTLAISGRLDEHLWSAVVGTTAAAVGLGLLLAYLYGKLARKRDELAAAETRLMAVNAQLKEADRAKSAFLADMSHELRTPMNAILGFSELLTEQLGPTLSERHRRFFTNIQVAGEHLLGLINDVLDLSKVAAGRLEIRPEVVGAAALLAPAAETARNAAARAGLTFEYHEQAAGPVRVDVTRTRQVLFNLLSNAIKFTPAPGTVTLSTRLDGDALVLEVRDTGIGIPEEAQRRVFGTFERVNRDRSDVQGTGLGLALTKRLVELQGGTIAFESEARSGTTFTVVLPDARYRVMASQSVLIVEDDRSDAELLAVLASDLGLKTHRVTTLAGALEATGRVRPLAVILDLLLPDGHGALILEMLKSSPQTSDVPVLVVTSATDTARFRLMGADVMTKPIENARVRSWLNRVAPPLAA